MTYHHLRKSGKLFSVFLLITAILSSYFIIVYVYPESKADSFAFIILAAAMFNFRVKVINPGPAKTASGAIVMSMGVFMNDAMTKFPWFIHSIGRLTVLMIFAFWLLLMMDYGISFFQGRFSEEHWSEPLNSFAMGTWIAGSSVCSMGIFMYVREWHVAAMVVIFLNTFLWLIYAGHSLIQLTKLIKIKTKIIDGIVLLLAVSTQSLVVDYSIWLLGDLPVWVARTMLLLGLLFYISSFILIIKSYASCKWKLTEDWKNTNCTIHGALSITGLAAIISKTVPVYPILLLWGIAFFLFIIVETIEVTRGIKRIKALGVRRALGTYNVSQWTRNFTFSMFLAFTLHLPIAGLSSAGKVIYHGFTNIFGSFILVLFVYEAFLFFKDKRIKI